jgi:hypothetical protein
LQDLTPAPGIPGHTGLRSSFHLSTGGDFELAVLVAFYELPGWFEVRAQHWEDLAIVTEGCYWSGCYAYTCRYSSTVRGLGAHVVFGSRAVPFRVTYRLTYDRTKSQVTATANGRLICRQTVADIADLDGWEVWLNFVSDAENSGNVHLEVEEVHVGYDTL